MLDFPNFELLDFFQMYLGIFDHKTEFLLNFGFFLILNFHFFRDALKQCKAQSSASTATRSMYCSIGTLKEARKCVDRRSVPHIVCREVLF